MRTDTRANDRPVASAIARLMRYKLLLGTTLVLGSFGLVAGTRAALGPPHARLSTAEPALPSDVPRVSFFALGDTGWQSPAKADVAAAMAAKAHVARPDFIALLGDNFYRSGVTSTRDPLWRTHFEEAYAAPELDLPFRPVLGNHDHDGNVQAQVEYSQQSARWKMAGFYYAFSEPLGPTASVDFFVVDTTSLRAKEDSAASQMRWLEEKLATSTGLWKIVLGHHPILSGGDHGGSSNVRAVLAPVFRRHGVDLYLSGHDHDLQILAVTETCLQIVSGAGSSTRPVEARSETLFAEAQPGFVWILATAHDLWIQMVTASDGVRGTHHVSKRLN